MHKNFTDHRIEESDVACAQVAHEHEVAHREVGDEGRMRQYAPTVYSANSNAEPVQGRLHARQGCASGREPGEVRDGVVGRNPPHTLAAQRLTEHGHATVVQRRLEGGTAGRQDDRSVLLEELPMAAARA